MVGAWLAMGRTATEIEQTMRGAFTPETVAQMFKLSMGGMSIGFDTHVRMCRETTSECSFADLQIPLIAMAVDLNTRRPAPIIEGPVWQALLATTALAGMFPPYEHQGQRLVDGVALEPVPTGAVIDAGADVTISVNLISSETLPTWPGQPPADEQSQKKQRAGMLAALLEVMDVTQLEASVRHAQLADVTITPRFGPGSWRDFDLADLYLAAGRTAAQEQLAALRQLARPQSG
jgi:NTE family protein